MYGIKMEIDGKLITQVDYTKLIKFENTISKVILPEQWIPTVYTDDLFGFEYSFFSLSSCGCKLKASEIKNAWLAFEKNDLPLSKVTEIFVLASIDEFFNNNYIPTLPFWVPVVELIDLLETCEQIKNLKGLPEKNTEIRRRIKGIVRGFEKNFKKTIEEKPQNLMNLYVRYANRLGDSITSFVSELRIARELTRYVGTERNIILKQSGSDINIDDLIATRIEVKRRIGDILPWCLAGLREVKPYEPVKFDGRTLLLMLCYLAFNQLERAFEKQNAQIVFVDVSYTLGGPAAKAAQSLLEFDFSFSEAIKKALELTNKGTKVVVPFASINGKNFSLIAKPIPYETVKNLYEKISTTNSEFKEINSLEFIKKLNEIEFDSDFNQQSSLSLYPATLLFKD